MLIFLVYKVTLSRDNVRVMVLGELIDLFHRKQGSKMLFKLSYWSIQLFSASALLSPSTITMYN